MSSTIKIENGDWAINKINGRPLLVSDNKALEQNLSEFLSIDTQPNGFGAGLDQLIGLIPYGDAIVANFIDSKIADGLTIFVMLQQSEHRIIRSSVEMLSDKFRSITLQLPDQTSYYVKIWIQTLANTGITTQASILSGA